MKSWILCASLLWCLVAFGQQPPEKPAFEVASIKPAKPSPMGQIRIGMSADAGMLRYTNVSLKDCIRVAYRVKDFQVQGPDWIESARFDITAKLPAGSSEDQIPEMLQALLADRFKLTLRRETKEHAVYALVVGKGGPKLKPAEVPVDKGDAPAGNSGKGAPPRNAMMMQMSTAGVHLKAPSVTLAGLAEMISRFSERPVVDMTAIQGQYDFDLVFSPETMRGMPRMMGGMPPGGGAGPMPAPGAGDRPPSDAPAEPGASIYDSVQRYGLNAQSLILSARLKTPTVQRSLTCATR